MPYRAKEDTGKPAVLSVRSPSLSEPLSFPAVFSSLDMSRSVSVTAAGQCRLAPLIQVILDCSHLYDYTVKLLFKLHSCEYLGAFHGDWELMETVSHVWGIAGHSVPPARLCSTLMHKQLFASVQVGLLIPAQVVPELLSSLWGGKQSLDLCKGQKSQRVCMG